MPRLLSGNATLFTRTSTARILRISWTIVVSLGSSAISHSARLIGAHHPAIGLSTGFRDCMRHHVCAKSRQLFHLLVEPLSRHHRHVQQYELHADQNN